MYIHELLYVKSFVIDLFDNTYKCLWLRNMDKPVNKRSATGIYQKGNRKDKSHAQVSVSKAGKNQVLFSLRRDTRFLPHTPHPIHMIHLQRFMELL